MKRNLIFRTALLLVLAMLYTGLPGTHEPGIQHALAAESGPSQPAPQPPKAIPAQPGFNQGGSQNDRPRPTTGMGGMAGMRGQAAAAAEQTPQRFPSQPAIGPGASQGYPQQPAASMGGMGSTGRSSDQGLTMREVLYILSLQDALQVMTELLAIQEKLLADPKASEKESLRKELTRIKGQVRKISADYREVLSGQLRGE
jgi:hypothetical protein